MRDEEKIRELTRRFAESCGLPIPHPNAPAGELHDSNGKLVLSWYKCPRHDTWMQPCYCGGIGHWHCAVVHEEGRCGYVRAAKLRSGTERELFRLWRHLESHG